MTNERQPGYYWVRLKGSDVIGEFTWTGKWWIHGYNTLFDDHHFDEIGNRITPEMRFTEEDMVELGWHAMSLWDATDEFSGEEMLDDWLKQKETE